VFTDFPSPFTPYPQPWPSHRRGVPLKVASLPSRSSPTSLISTLDSIYGVGIIERPNSNYSDSPHVRIISRGYRNPKIYRKLISRIVLVRSRVLRQNPSMNWVPTGHYPLKRCPSFLKRSSSSYGLFKRLIGQRISKCLGLDGFLEHSKQKTQNPLKPGMVPIHSTPSLSRYIDLHNWCRGFITQREAMSIFFHPSWKQGRLRFALR
jgi:hypothetical protein